MHLGAAVEHAFESCSAALIWELQCSTYLGAAVEHALGTTVEHSVLYPFIQSALLTIGHYNEFLVGFKASGF